MGIRSAIIAATAVAAGILTSCGGADDDSPADVRATPKVTVVLTDGAYRPACVQVSPGNRVTFFNRSESPNTAETDGIAFFEIDRAKLDRQNLFDIHTLQRGEAESVELDTPGAYRFHSSLDDEMKGVIEVVEPPR